MFLFLLLAGIITLIVALVARQGPRGGPSAGVDALEILRQRYACGETNREEYENMRQDLQG
ncbi:MAG: SHOCT domain-containing protein [Anaerolineae bacterium]